METVEVLIPREELEKRIAELGKRLNEFYKGEEVYAVCVLKGGVMFMVNLIMELDCPVLMNFMSVSSYGSGTESSGTIQVNMDIDKDLTGKKVLFIEDIIDSGRTIDFLIRRAKERNAADIKVCTLLYKPEKMVFDIPIDFVAFEIPSDFVVGYGLDYDQKYRNLPYIGVLHFS